MEVEWGASGRGPDLLANSTEGRELLQSTRELGEQFPNYTEKLANKQGVRSISSDARLSVNSREAEVRRKAAKKLGVTLWTVSPCAGGRTENQDCP